MAGGNWVPSDIGNIATRPGLYVNFESAATAAVAPGQRGVVALAAISDWGPDASVQTLESEADIITLYGNNDSATAKMYRQAREAFLGGALKVMAWRLLGANAVKATRTLVDTNGSPNNVIRIDGKYYGAYGNDLSLSVAANASDATMRDIKLYRSGVLLRTWTSTIASAASGFIDNVVSLINSDAGNIWVVATKLANGINTLATITTQALASGANGDALIGSNYTSAFDAFELQNFNVFTTDTVSDSIRASLVAWIKTLRNTSGKKVTAVVGSDTGDVIANATSDTAGMDDEGVDYVFPGLQLPNVAGALTTYNGANSACRVAGMIASADIGKSVTFAKVTGATDVETRLSNADIGTALSHGILVLSWNGRYVHIEKGINSLQTLGSKPASFKKIVVVQTIDTISNAIKEAAEDSYIGQVPNDEVGQRALINSVSDFLNTMLRTRAIKPGFTVALDSNYDSTGDQVFLRIGLTPVDAVEEIFTTIVVGS